MTDIEPKYPDSKLPVYEAVAKRFRAEFGGEETAVYFAPGRLNLVGAHLDYSGGDVLPLAVDLGVYAAARLRDDQRIRLRSIDQEVDVDLDWSEIGDVMDPATCWGRYPLGVMHFMAVAGAERRGVELVFGGNLPIASGMSSSAALEVVTATALDDLLGCGMTAIERARLCHRAEVEFVGVKCGIMDQFASALGKKDHALLLHCFDETYEHVHLDGSAFEVLVMDTKKPRSLAATGFNDRVTECREAHQILRREVRDLPYLAAYSMADLESAGDALHGVHRKRAHHVVTEMGRISEGVRGLRADDIHVLGHSLNESHRSTSVDYEVSCDELDFITDSARELDLVFGARLTGAGFGGCAIALVETGESPKVIEHVRARFAERFGVTASFECLHPGEGPRRLS